MLRLAQNLFVLLRVQGFINVLHHVQVIAATNRADILDPALMRSGRLDRKIEFPHPNEDARAKVRACCMSPLRTHLSESVVVILTLS
jgi:ATP-dependent 26S proteasome regulatory subunit